MNPRSPSGAALLSALLPGLGHIYTGELKKGVLLICIPYGVLILVGIFGLLSTFYGLVSVILLAIVFYLYSIFSSFKAARRNHNYQLRAFNRWFYYVAIIIFVSTAANALLSFRGQVLGYEAYRIPAKSMEPTLQVGDFITVTTRYDEPTIGDVVVFLYPKNKSISYVKRIAALGGDVVSIDNGKVFVNGEYLSILDVSKESRQKEFSISLERIVIPENEIFLLGDWRDQSNDSRFWGPVPTSDVVGQVTYIWFSNDFDRIGRKVE
jgi:signal peptidase I